MIWTIQSNAYERNRVCLPAGLRSQGLHDRQEGLASLRFLADDVFGQNLLVSGIHASQYVSVNE